MKYNGIITFTKRTNLLGYFLNNPEYCAQQYCVDLHSVGAMEHLRSIYARERDVKLIVLERFDGNKTFCTIKCPINPLPVKGEFEVPSFGALRRFLVANGWTEVNAVSTRFMD